MAFPPILMSALKVLGVYGVLRPLTKGQRGKLLRTGDAGLTCLAALRDELRRLVREYQIVVGDLAPGRRIRRQGRPGTSVSLLRRLKIALSRQRDILMDLADPLPASRRLALRGYLDRERARVVEVWLRRPARRKGPGRRPSDVDRRRARAALLAFFDAWETPLIKREGSDGLARWTPTPDPATSAGDVPGVEAYRSLLAAVKEARARSAPLCAGPDCGHAVEKHGEACSPTCADRARGAADPDAAHRAEKWRQRQAAGTRRREEAAAKARLDALAVVTASQHDDKIMGVRASRPKGHVSLLPEK